MNPHLFVYGSLMSSARHPMGERLARGARWLGDATIPGRLYAISWYPGVAEPSQPDERVHGEVYRLDNVREALEWLDAYEGIVPGSANLGEYERVERLVRLASGAEIAAWVYLYRRDVSGLVPIPGGRWLAGRR